MCEYVDEFGNWDKCPDYINCTKAHTLYEQLYNPCNYKIHECSFGDRNCRRLQPFCAHYHSENDRDLAKKAL